MSQEYRRKVTTTRTSTSYGATGNRSAWGYWVPLALTVTAATVALGAWIWSERSDEEDNSESEAEHYYASGAQQGRRDQSNIGTAAVAAGAAGLGAAAGYGGMSGGPPPGPGPTGSSSGPTYAGNMPGPPAQGGFIGAPGPQGPPGPPSRGEADSYFRDTSHHDQTISTTNVNTQSTQQEPTFFGRMSNALGMNRSVTPGGTNAAEGAGWAAAATGALAVAGGMVEKAVQQVRGSQDDAHSSDQEKWAEEADKPERTQSTLSAAAAGTASAASLRRGSGARSKSPAPGIARQGTAQEFYSGSVDLPRRTSMQAKKRRTVAVVVSSVDGPGESLSVDTHHSILAQLPQHIHPDTTKIVVLIYAPELHTHPLSFVSRRAGERAFERRASASVHSNTSSYQHIHTPGSNLGTEPLNTPLQTPGDFPQDAINSNSDDQGILAHVDPKPMDSSTSLVRIGSHNNDESGHTNPLDEQTSALFKTLYNQASAIVDRDTSILLYTSSNGHKHILKSVQPEMVYIQESLCGRSGEIVAELHGWVRQVVVVIGDEGGMGALIDSDAEVESEEDSNGHRKSGMTEGEKWWKREEVSGVGRGVSVVEGLRVGEDWERRVNETE